MDFRHSGRRKNLEIFVNIFRLNGTFLREAVELTHVYGYTLWAGWPEETDKRGAGPQTRELRNEAR